MHIFKQAGFLAAAQCVEIRRGMDAGDIEPAEVLAAGVQRDVQVRVASLIEPPENLARDIEAMLDGCRNRVAEVLRLSLSEREGAGCIRYPAGGFYRAHRDRGNHPQWEPAARRAAAVVVFLNTSRANGGDGEFDGGILRLHLPQGTIDVVPEAGLLVAFPADVLHEVTEVRDGTRDTIVDWSYD